MGKIRGGRENRALATPYPREGALGRSGGPRDDGSERSGGVTGALALTFVSTLVWGFAHLWMGRRKTGLFLLGLYWLMVAAMVAVVTVFPQSLLQWSVRPDLLTAITIGSLVRVLLCLPFGWAARYTNIYRDTLTSIFESGDSAKRVNTANPWAGKRRVNVLLLGGDAAGNRVGVRTDSMTLASVDTRTGDTVLLGLPRNLEHFPMPAGLPQQRFPNGFAGDGPQTPGLLNEVYA